MNSTILIIVVVVAAVLALSAGISIVAKRFGMSVINIPAAIVNAVKEALEGSSLAGTKLAVVLDAIVQALAYVQAICDSSVTMETKVQKALAYITDILAELGVTLTDAETAIITNVLQIGFTVMVALGVNSSASYAKLYTRMAKYARIDKAQTKAALDRMSRRVEAYQHVNRNRGRN